MKFNRLWNFTSQPLAAIRHIVWSAAAWLLAVPGGLFWAQPAAAGAPPTRPNIVLILADDLGFSDLGCYGGETQTPVLDGLAAGGLRFTQFYNTARCWPTRAAILTGYYAQQVRRDSLPGVQNAAGGSQGVRPAWARLLPEMLRPLGYRSYHSGKWHVDGARLAGGFDRSYSLEDHNRHFHPRDHLQDDKPLPAVGPHERYYSSSAIIDHALGCLADHAGHYADQPFFQYVAFTAPHFPLHAPAADIDRCRPRYAAGWNQLRRQRWEAQRELKLLDCPLSAIELDIGPPYHFPEALAKLGPGEVNRPFPWSELTSAQQDFQADKMAVHAAMVEVLDREVGRLVQFLRQRGMWDNTLILFLSDNGASAEIMVRGDGHDPSAPPGAAESFLCLGPGWSSVANTPFRRHKSWVHEGGIATPLIAHWPKGITAQGELRRTPGHVIDFVPTLLEIAGAEQHAARPGDATPALPGKSLAPAFARDETISRDYLWWLHEGHRAVRVGDMKLVSDQLNGGWQLYDLSRDRAETHDLAGELPDKVQELEGIWSDAFRDFARHAALDPPGQP